MKVLSKKRFLCCFSIVFLVTTIIFFVDPSLCLRKSMHYSDFEYHIESVVSYVICGYLSLQVLNITWCYLFLSFPAKHVAYWTIIAASLFAFVLPSYTQFPTLGQMSLVWSDDKAALSWDLGRYELLLAFLHGWIINNLLETLAFHIYWKGFRRKKKPLNSIRKHGKLQRHGNFARMQSSSVCSLWIRIASTARCVSSALFLMVFQFLKKI